MDITALFDLSYGMYLIGATAEGMPTGCIVNTLGQITAEPELVSVSIHHENFTSACIQNTRQFSVSVLSERTDPSIIRRFGFKSGRDTEKFAGFSYEKIDHDLPVLSRNICGWLQCKVEQIVDVGTHALFIAQVTDCKRSETPMTPMTYEYYHKVIKGGAPKKAPTFQFNSLLTKEEPAAPRKYVCDVCGYVYDGDLSELPDDWKCPVCGVGKEHFRKA